MQEPKKQSFNIASMHYRQKSVENATISNGLTNYLPTYIQKHYRGFTK